MNEQGSHRLAVENLDALISELETEYTQVREFGVDAMPVTNNCTGHPITLGNCCKTL
jgi:hypothetical protein